MNTILQNNLCAATVGLGAGRTFQNLALFPLWLAPNADLPAPTYHTLDESLALGTVEITETSDSGTVPELKLRNTGSRPVLLLDGEELLGAKQNRTVNLTTLVATGAEILLPVTCVEAGRWHQDADSVRFQSSRQAHFAEGRAAKQATVSEGLRACNVPRADQGEVWERIAAKGARLRTASPTGAMEAIFAAHSGTVEEYVSALMNGVNGREVGGVFVLNGQVFGMERFDAPKTWATLLPKIIRSFALDAVDKQNEPTKALPSDAVTKFLARIAAAPVQTYPATGMGENLRLREPGLTGAALAVDSRLVHLSAFRLPDDAPREAATPTATGRARASARMRR